MGKRPLFSNFSFLQSISFENLAFLISNDSIKDGQSLEMDVKGRGYAPPWRGMSENLKKVAGNMCISIIITSRALCGANK